MGSAARSRDAGEPPGWASGLAVRVVFRRWDPGWFAHGALRVTHELSLEGVKVSSGGACGVWSRHKLLIKQERLLSGEYHLWTGQVGFSRLKTCRPGMKASAAMPS